MNPFAYRTTGLAIKALSALSKAKIHLHGTENIPKTSNIFVINHFTRIETFLLPYHINRLTKSPVWSLASVDLFKGALGNFLDHVGAVSTRNPDRDRLIVKSLLTGEAMWIIFPEGRMVKNKKIIEKGRFMISFGTGKTPPHTGAATLALRTEFYRQRLRELITTMPEEAKRLLDLFEIRDIKPVLNQMTHIVPVNLTYYPIRAQENILSHLARRWVEDIPERILEEIMTEGTMLLSGVDLDIRFGKPIKVQEYMKHVAIDRDIGRKKQINFDDPIASKKIMRKMALKIMHRYMETIYALTTVNHDHLFATILRKLPFDRIREKDLRQRVFLASTFGTSSTRVHTHRSLNGDQTHLITDDRFHQYRDFIRLALDKKLVIQRQDVIIRTSSKELPFLDFHRIRIDNPLAVTANAVEPLVVLQRKLSLIARMPMIWIRHKIYKLLLAKARMEFLTDYRRYYLKKESKKKNIGEPILIKGKTRKVGVVLLHGYMAAPMEMSALADYLGRKGLWVYVPRLKGHGTSPEDLSTRTVNDWMVSADEGYAIISSMCNKVVVGGFSNGGGLALDLAARVRGLKGVFAVCPPLKLKDLAAKFVPTVDTWNRFMDKVHFESAKVEFVENRPENPHINYTRNPISGVRELERLMESVEAKLPDIRIPALIVQSDGDPVVDPKGARQVYELLGSKNKTYLPFQLDRHGILLGDGSRQVHQAIGDFISGL